MNKRIIYTRPDGGVSVVVPTREHIARFDTEDDAISEIMARSVPPDATFISTVEDAELPSDRTFRNAWRQSGSIVSVNIPLARAIHAERMGAAQSAEIARLKVEERKERLKGNTTKAAAHAATITALEALDLSVLATQIANAPNPTALSAIWPANVPR